VDTPQAPLPCELRRARASLATPPPSQRTLGRLLCQDRSEVHRLERGARRPRGLLLEVVLALVLATRRGADMRGVLDAERPRGERLALLFAAAYLAPPEGPR
jgi:hypothetical protein